MHIAYQLKSFKKIKFNVYILFKIDSALKSISVADIKKLESNFDSIADEIAFNSDVDETLDSMEKYASLSLKVIRQYEAEIVYLKQQVLELDQLNRTLKHECFANTIFIPELWMFAALLFYLLFYENYFSKFYDYEEFWLVYVCCFVFVLFFLFVMWYLIKNFLN